MARYNVRSWAGLGWFFVCFGILVFKTHLGRDLHNMLLQGWPKIYLHLLSHDRGPFGGEFVTVSVSLSLKVEGFHNKWQQNTNHASPGAYARPSHSTATVAVHFSTIFIILVGSYSQYSCNARALL